MSSITSPKIDRSSNLSIGVSTLVVFDSRVSDIETLSKALLPGAVSFTIDAEDDGLETITQLLAATGAKYLAIVAHGEPGVVHLGKNPLNIEQLQAQSQLLSAWGVKEIALYSCEVAKDDVGKDFIYQLSELTGATVAAAATKTGNHLLGGSWDLTVTTGAIAAPSLFDLSILETYPAVLALSFGADTGFVVGGGANSVTVGDFNGDGNLDLAAARGENNIGNVSVLLGNGTGGFGAVNNFGMGNSRSSITAGDFNGDSKLDFATTVGNNVSVRLNTTVPDPVRNDFNGDGKSDILWRNDFGSVALWQMNGATVTSGSLTSVPNIDASWKAAGTGDFNGDGKSDILWRNTSGAIAVWAMNGPTVTSSTLTSTPSLDNSWTIAGNSDYNGDGKSDILWRNTNGAVAVWTMDGATVTSSSLTSTPSVDNSWKVAGNSDFNGDGKADILWRNDDGSVALWQMNGAAITASTAVAKVATDWKIAGTGDFNGDSKADILWRNDDGRVALWQMNGAAITSSSLTSTPSRDSSQTIAGIGDYNGDGKADILWRKDTGALEVWQMNGSTVVSSTLTSVAADSSNWKIAAPII